MFRFSTRPSHEPHHRHLMDEQDDRGHAEVDAAPSEKSKTRMRQALLGLLLLQLSGPALAMHWSLVEEQYASGPIISDIDIDDVLGEDPRPYLKIYPDKNQEHRKLVEILDAGMPFSGGVMFSETAKILAGFPSECHQSMGLSMIVSPIEHIDRFVPNVSDKRRLVGMFIGNCVEVDIPQCIYDQSTLGNVNFGADSFFNVLRACRDATNQAVQRGAPYAGDVYEAHPKLIRPISIP